MRAIVLLGLSLPLSVNAGDLFGAGAKGGALLGPVDRTRQVASGGGGQQRDFIRPYVVGLALVVDTPFSGIRIEADLLYRRFSRDFSARRGGFGHYYRYSGNTWEVPVLIERRLPLGSFLGGGVSWRHIWGATLELEQFNGGLAPDRVFPRESVDIGDRDQAGWVGVGGVERKLGGARYSIEARYTRWTSLLFQPSRNQTDLMVGVRF